MSACWSHDEPGKRSSSSTCFAVAASNLAINDAHSNQAGVGLLTPSASHRATNLPVFRFFGIIAATFAIAATTSTSPSALSACRNALPSVARTLSHDMPRNPAAETTTVAARLVPPGA
jgi:hypothetical protein